MMLTNRPINYISQSPLFGPFLFFFSASSLYFSKKKFERKNSLNISKSKEKTTFFSLIFHRCMISYHSAAHLFISHPGQISSNFSSTIDNTVSIPSILFPNQLLLCPDRQTGSLSTDIGRGCQKWPGRRFAISQIVHISHNICTVINF